MIYVLAALLPPLGLLLNGQPFSAVFSLVLIVLCVLLYGVTIVSELVKMHGKKVQGRDRHP